MINYLDINSHEIEYTRYGNHKVIELDLAQTMLFALSNNGIKPQLVPEPKQAHYYWGSFDASKD